MYLLERSYKLQATSYKLQEEIPWALLLKQEYLQRITRA
ncbi:hypothetical protein JCM19232_2390 [Vibrio ishigakensis]|uniref:Uncharacterized protein n=1 Tax=Vibrio ishigakensis TaxID=1481914 RepID=A0A0B8PB35_9VIBR|nr:hypothetical protein JCM19232_2390 [Vibrio ishigakensis]